MQCCRGLAEAPSDDGEVQLFNLPCVDKGFAKISMRCPLHLVALLIWAAAVASDTIIVSSPASHVLTSLLFLRVRRIKNDHTEFKETPRPPALLVSENVN